MTKTLRVENLEALGEKVVQTAEGLKDQSQALLKEGERFLRRSGREFKKEFQRHPVAVTLAGAAVAGALVYLLIRK